MTTSVSKLPCDIEQMIADTGVREAIAQTPGASTKILDHLARAFNYCGISCEVVRRDFWVGPKFTPGERPTISMMPRSIFQGLKFADDTYSISGIKGWANILAGIQLNKKEESEKQPPLAWVGEIVWCGEPLAVTGTVSPDRRLFDQLVLSIKTTRANISKADIVESLAGSDEAGADTINKTSMGPRKI